jgi:hypothetical protein
MNSIRKEKYASNTEGKIMLYLRVLKCEPISKVFKRQTKLLNTIELEQLSA